MLALVLLLAAAPLLAHTFAHPKRLLLSLDAAQVAVVIDLEFSPGPQAQGLRAAYDQDHDGRLDAREQGLLLRYLAQRAALETRVEVDERVAWWQRPFVERWLPLALAPQGEPRGERLDDRADSSALLAVQVRLAAPWPAASGRRRVRLSDASAGADGHVPVRVACAGCEILAASAGTFAHDPRGDQVLGAEASAGRPLRVEVALRPPEP